MKFEDLLPVCFFRMFWRLLSVCLDWKFWTCIFSLHVFCFPYAPELRVYYVFISPYQVVVFLFRSPSTRPPLSLRNCREISWLLNLASSRLLGILIITNVWKISILRARLFWSELSHKSYYLSFSLHLLDMTFFILLLLLICTALACMIRLSPPVTCDSMLTS